MTSDQPVSPLAPASFPTLPAVAGVQLSAHAGELRYRGRDDLMLAQLSEGTTVAGTFTRSLCPSAPVDWCRRIIDRGSARAVVCNAGNANAFTGSLGQATVALTAEVVASGLGIEADDVYLASTGVIGEPMPDDELAAALSPLIAGVAASSPATWMKAAGAIRTTDTFAKGSARPVGTSGAQVVGIAKGSGMIAPDMATMLAFVFTDLAVPADELQQLLSASVDRSFNRITVDSDTSTSDTVLLFATGASGVGLDAARDAFTTALDEVLLDLAQQIVRDGEGATKFVSVQVTGAADDEAAAIIARSIPTSPLVKTALAAEDANWGRIVMAVGKAGQQADRDRLTVWIGDEQVTENGVVRGGYSEERATEHLRNDEVSVRADVGVGDGSATVWTCDLTHGYIDINASYRS